jgi:chromosome segregation ATPase
MSEERRLADLNKEFEWINEHIDRFSKAVHDHISRLEEGQLDKMSTSLQDLSERVRAMEQAIEQCKKDISDLALEISNLDTTIKVATSER